MHRLMHITEKGLKKIASMRVVTQTKSAVGSIVRATSSIIRPSRDAAPSSSSSSSSMSSENNPSSIPEDSSYRVLDHVYSPSSTTASSSGPASPSSISSSDAIMRNSANVSPRAPRSPRFAPPTLNLDNEREGARLERSGSMVQVIKDGIKRGSTTLARSLGVSDELAYTELQAIENNNNNNNDGSISARRRAHFDPGLDADLEIVEMDDLSKDDKNTRL